MVCDKVNFRPLCLRRQLISQKPLGIPYGTINTFYLWNYHTLQARLGNLPCFSINKTWKHGSIHSMADGIWPFCHGDKLTVVYLALQYQMWQRPGQQYTANKGQLRSPSREYGLDKEGVFRRQQQQEKLLPYMSHKQATQPSCTLLQVPAKVAFWEAVLAITTKVEKPCSRGRLCPWKLHTGIWIWERR